MATTVRRLKATVKVDTKDSAKRLKKTDQQVTKLRKSLAMTIRQTRQLKHQMAAMAKTTKRTTGNLVNFSSTLGTLGVAGAVLAVVNSMKEGILVAAKFEKTMANVFTLLDQQTLKTFRKELELGSLTMQKEFGFSIEKTNKALFDAISAGVQAGDSIKFLRTAAKLAVGGVTDISVAVDGLTSVMNAFGRENFDATKTANAFFTAQKFGKTTVQALASNIGKVAPVANAAGASFNQTASALSALTLAGLSTEESTTALKAVFTAVIKPSSGAAKAFKKLNISLVDNKGQLRDVGAILQNVAKATKGNIIQAAKLFPNIRALTGVAALSSDQLAKYNEILKATRKDTMSLNEAAKTQAKTFTNTMGRLSGALRVAVIKGFRPIEKAFSMFFGWLEKTGLTDELIKALSFLGKVVLVPIIGAIASLTIVLGPAVALFVGLTVAASKAFDALMLVGKVVLKLLEPAFARLAPVFNFLSKQFQAMKTNFLDFLSAVMKPLTTFIENIKIFAGVTKLVGGSGLGGGRQKAPVRTAGGGGIGAEPVRDLIISGDRVFKTSPRDNILATENDLGAMGGGKTQIGSLINKLSIVVNDVSATKQAIVSQVEAALDELSFKMAEDAGV
jgi:TP901 family phage tail tape measure protein